MRRRRAMFVATTLVTVASMVSELSMAVAKAAVCVGVLNWSAVMPVNAMFDETTTTGTTTTGGVGIAVGSGLGADVGTGIGGRPRPKRKSNKSNMVNISQIWSKIGPKVVPEMVPKSRFCLSPKNEVLGPLSIFPMSA